MLTLTKSEMNKIGSLFSKMSSVEDFKAVADMFKSAQASNNAKLKATFSVGDTVSFTKSKTGEVVIGTLIKKNPKYQHIQTDSGVWRVPTSMLSAA